MFERFAAAEELQISIAPEKLFEIGNFTIYNSMIYGWISSVAIIIILILARKKLKVGSIKGPAQLLDAGVEFIVKTMENTLGSRRMAVKYAPLFATIFFFIMMSNLMGLLPGVGHALTYDGINLLRPFTADLNGTLAMAIFGIVVVQIIAIKEAGLKGYGKHFFPGKLYNPATYLIGAFEIFTEFTRLITLALRLFLNIAVGEILISVFSDLAGYAGPLAGLPFTLLEIFVGMLQAYIFVVLMAAYLSLAASHSEKIELEHA